MNAHRFQKKPQQTYEAPSMADVESWIAVNPTREFLPPKHAAPVKLAPVVSVAVAGPWPGTHQHTVMKQYPYTSAYLWVTDPAWRELDVAGKLRTCEEARNKLYLGWADTFKTRGYKSLGWKAVDVETVLANTRQDPLGDSETDKQALHALADNLDTQFIYVDDKEYTLVPQEWNPDATHILLAKTKTGPQLVVPADSDTWTLQQLATCLSNLTYGVQPRKKDLVGLTAAELKDSCAAAELKLTGRATKESMWIALQQHAMLTFWNELVA